MLTISINESLPGAPGAWPSEWDAAAADQPLWSAAAGFTEEAVALEAAYQQQCAAEAVAQAWASFNCLGAMGGLPGEEVDTSKQWSLYSQPHEWAAKPEAQNSEPGTAFKRSADSAISKTTAAAPAPETAWASPLRVPLPEPLSSEPFSALEYDLELNLLEVPEAPKEPRKIETPPGLSGALSSTPVAPTSISTSPSTWLSQPVPTAPAAPASNSVSNVADHAPPGMSISSAEVGGRACTKVEWRIDDFSGKLQASSGRPVVSPAFSAAGLCNLRLMVFPDARDIVKSARSHERKNLYSNMVKKGPLYSSLKLKADGLERATVMTFSLLVGSVRVGPHSYDFSEQAVRGPEDFGVDWLQQVEKVSGSLRVSIEIFEVQDKA